MSSVKDKYIYP